MNTLSAIVLIFNLLCIIDTLLVRRKLKVILHETNGILKRTNDLHSKIQAGYCEIMIDANGNAKLQGCLHFSGQSMTIEQMYELKDKIDGFLEGRHSLNLEPVYY